jgi:hypothetical protein
MNRIHKTERSGIYKKEITLDTVKKDVLTYFFDRINTYEYRYLMMKTVDDFKKNEKNIEYVIPHIKGDPYYLLFGTFDRKQSVYFIEKKKLKFNLDQCNIDEIKIYSCDIKSTAKTYIGTVFDGRFVQDIFLIQDCYVLEGIKMNAWKLDKKIEYLDEYLTKYMKNPYLKIRKVDLISNIEELDRTISKSSVDINGFIFMQARSGVSYIFIDGDNSNKKIENKVTSATPATPVHKDVIINSELSFIIKKDSKPDVYHVYDKENNLIHFASIPDTFTSQLCYEALKNVDSAVFNCVLCPKWKRYKPVECIN